MVVGSRAMAFRSRLRSGARVEVRDFGGYARAVVDGDTVDRARKQAIRTLRFSHEEVGSPGSNRGWQAVRLSKLSVHVEGETVERRVDDDGRVRPVPELQAFAIVVRVGEVGANPIGEGPVDPRLAATSL